MPSSTSSTTCPTPAEVDDAIQSCLEPHALFAEDAYLTTLTEANSAVAILEAIQLLERAHVPAFASDLKDCLHDALATRSHHRIADAHATAIAMLQAADIPHNLPDPTPPGTLLRPRASTTRLLSISGSLPPDDTPPHSSHPPLSTPITTITTKTTSAAHTTRLNKTIHPSTTTPTNHHDAHNKRPLPYHSTPHPPPPPPPPPHSTTTTTCRRPRISSCLNGIVWTTFAACLLTAVVWASLQFARARRQPIVQRTVSKKQDLQTPSLFLCFPVDGFPALANMQNFSFSPTARDDNYTTWTLTRSPPVPIFAIRRLKVPNGAPPTASAIVHTEQYIATQTPESSTNCQQQLAAFDVTVHKRLDDPTRQIWPQPCQACWNIVGGYQIPGNRIDPVSVIKAEIVTDPFVDQCFVSRLFDFALIEQVAMDLQGNSQQLIQAGLLDLNGHTPSGQQNMFFSSVPVANPQAAAAVAQHALAMYQDMLEFMCNIWFFSGFFSPAIQSNLSYVYVPNKFTFNTAPPITVAGWNLSTGQAFKIPAFPASPLQALPLSPPSNEDTVVSAIPPIDGYITPVKEKQLQNVASQFALGRQELVTIRARIDVNLNHSFRYLPVTSASSWIQIPDAVRGRSDFNFYMLDFGFTSFLSHTGRIVPVANFSLFLADMLNLIEVFLGLTVFSVVVYFLSLPLQVASSWNL